VERSREARRRGGKFFFFLYGFVLGWGAGKNSQPLVPVLVAGRGSSASASAAPPAAGPASQPSQVSFPPTPGRQFSTLLTHLVQSTNHHYSIISL